jgi:hypothetical protein
MLGPIQQAAIPGGRATNRRRANPNPHSSLRLFGECRGPRRSASRNALHYIGVTTVITTIIVAMHDRGPLGRAGNRLAPPQQRLRKGTPITVITTRFR